MTLFIELFLKSVGILGLAAAVAWLMRNSSAAWRHRIWGLGFVTLAVLPLLAVRLPEIPIERPEWTVDHQVPAAKAIAVPEIQSFVKEPVVPMPSTAPKSESGPWLASGLVMIWGLGVAVMLLRTAGQLFIAWRRTSRGKEVSVDPARRLPPQTWVMQSSTVDVPMTLGFLRPRIVLPECSNSWTAERFNAVLLHEGAHVRRGDWAWAIFARVVAAFYWPNPLVYFAASQMRIESEHAADNAVLEAGVDAPVYAATLVDLAEGVRGRSLGTALPFVEQGTLKERVSAVLKGTGPRGPLGRAAAIATLVMGGAIVFPYAAARIVTGPEAIIGGAIDLPDGGRMQIVAITQMRGREAVSWDMRGALLRRPFAITKVDMEGFQILNPHPASSPVCYVVFRSNRPSGYQPTYLLPSGKRLSMLSYSGSGDPEGLGNNDAAGGSYWIIEVPAPKGQTKTSLTLSVGGPGWKLYAYSDYKNGAMSEVLNPTAGLRILPSNPQYGKGTQVSFVLPPEFADRESSVRIFPDSTMEQFFQGETGAQTAASFIAPTAVTRVEIRSRPLRMVVIPDIPLEPNPNVAYIPRRFLPEETITAKDGVVRLPDGSTLGIERVSDFRGRGWDADGNLAVRNPHLEMNDRTLGAKPADPAKRHLRIWFHQTPGGAPAPQELFDDEGWALCYRSTLEVYPREQFGDFEPTVASSLQKLGLVAQVSYGGFRTIARIEPGVTKETTRTFASGSLRVDYPVSIAEQEKGMDVEISALDEKGNPVKGADDGSAYDPGWVEFFNLPRAAADRVKTVEIKVRPYAWVEFPHVALEPKG